MATLIRCYITNRHALPGAESLLDAIARNIADGVDWIQIREKDLSPRELLGLTHRAIALARRHTNIAAKIIVNGLVDVALAAGADGVHLPAGSIPPRRWREITHGRAKSGFLIGTSCHSIDEVRCSEAEGADYVVFGPVFAPLSKGSDLAPRGLESLAQAAQSVRIPVLALGGITAENAFGCVSAGAAGIAGISLFQNP
jgi:thiamine-phosphate pyrophosphorylase